jgi:hypothetical protein
MWIKSGTIDASFGAVFCSRKCGTATSHARGCRKLSVGCAWRVYQILPQFSKEASQAALNSLH